MNNANTQETQKKFKTQAEYVESLKQHVYEVESILESAAEIKEEIKAAGYDATLLVKVAKAFAANKASEIVEKNELFAEIVSEVMDGY